MNELERVVLVLPALEQRAKPRLVVGKAQRARKRQRMPNRALAADRPAVLDVHCDPDVPPIPPHATFEQAKSMMEALLKGDEGGLHLAVQGAKTKLVVHQATFESEEARDAHEKGWAGCLECLAEYLAEG